MRYTIRTAVPADEKRIRELFLEMLRTITHTEDVEGYEDGYLDKFWSGNEHQIFVAEEEDVIAYLSVEVHHEHGDYLYLDDFSVTEAFRNKGIGKELLRTAESYAEKIHIPELYLHVEKTNERALRLYERSGYSICRDDKTRYLLKKTSLIDSAIAYIEVLFRDDAGGHDAAHTLRVYHNAMAIAETEPGCDQETVALAALLHDADDYKLFHTENNENARTFLKNSGLPKSRIEKIVAVINAVSFSKNREKTPETLEAMIVQDADRLDALGAIGIARTFAYGGAHHRPLQDSVQHFNDKLLLLKDLMNTDAAKAIAKKRHEFLLKFLQELKTEL